MIFTTRLKEKIRGKLNMHSKIILLGVSRPALFLGTYFVCGGENMQCYIRQTKSVVASVSTATQL